MGKSLLYRHFRIGRIPEPLLSQEYRLRTPQAQDFLERLQRS